MGKSSPSRPPPSPPVHKPPKTVTLPESQRIPHVSGPDEVTALHLCGTERRFGLPELGTVWIGSDPECEIHIPSPHLSQRHVEVERRPNVMRIYDRGTKNGTYVVAHDGIAGRSVVSRDILPGESFTAGGLTFVALNQRMREAWDELEASVGLETERPMGMSMMRSPSEILSAALMSSHILITGGAGLAQDRLARIIHDVSLWRQYPFQPITALPTDPYDRKELVRQATRGTVVLHLGSALALDNDFVSLVFDPSYRIRVIVDARNTQDAYDALHGRVATMTQINLRSLADRRRAVLTLLDRAFARLGTPLQTSDITDANQQALTAYEWPGNLVELETAAVRLRGVTQAPSLRKAAPQISLPLSTLRHWYREQLKLAFPLVRDQVPNDDDN